MKQNLTDKFKDYWEQAKQGELMGKFKSVRKLNKYRVSYKLTAAENLYSPVYKRKINTKEAISISSFPQDFNFLDIKPQYIMGMSVPPIMMAQVANQVYLQLIKQ